MTGLPLPLLRISPPGGARIAALRRRLGSVFTAVDFPAPRWQVVIAADSSGADYAVRRALHELKASTYPDATSVLAELADSAPIFEALMRTAERSR
jgi:hypothetical protein